MTQFNQTEERIGEELLRPILEAADAALEASRELLELLRSGEGTGALEEISALRGVVEELEERRRPLSPLLEHAYAGEQLDNLRDTLETMTRALERGDSAEAGHLAEYQLVPFWRLLREAFYFWGWVCPDSERRRQYYAREFVQNYKNPYFSASEPSKYRVSVAVPAYNNLEKTKLCVESILQHTDFDKWNGELILIDHGSTDGTLAYFHSIPRAKVIHMKNNVRMYMFTLLAMVCEGDVLVFANNDAMVTHGWLDKLLAALDASDDVALACPMTPNTSNLQAPPPRNGETLAEFLDRAGRESPSDPSLWDERVRLLPAVGAYRMSALERVGLADPYFYTMEFWDDDSSLRLRREGFRQILCRDTICYHFGSSTGGEAQRRESTLEVGRSLFKDKHDIDPWGTGFCYDHTAILLLQQHISLMPEDCAILGIDCGMGDTLLQIRNEFRHLHRNCSLFHVTDQEEYEADLKAFVDGYSLVDSWRTGVLDSTLEEKRFHVIYVGRRMEDYPNIEDLLASLRSHMYPGGYLIFWCENPFFGTKLSQMLSFSMDQPRQVFLNPEWLRQRTEHLGIYTKLIPLTADIGGIDGFLQAHFQGLTGQTKAAVKRVLQTQRYYFLGKGSV